MSCSHFVVFVLVHGPRTIEQPDLVGSGIVFTLFFTSMVSGTGFFDPPIATEATVATDEEDDDDEEEDDEEEEEEAFVNTLRFGIYETPKNISNKNRSKARTNNGIRNASLSLSLYYAITNDNE